MKYIATLLLALSFVKLSDAQFKYINPLPGSDYHNPSTTIILKNGNLIDRESLKDKDLVEISGSVSGHHEWTAKLSDDNKTVIIKPIQVFAYGEKVFVTINSLLRKMDGEKIEGTSFTFDIKEKTTPEQEELFRQARIEFKKDYDFQPKPDDIDPLDSMPTFTININNNPAPGQIFYANREDANPDGTINTNNFATIINNDGSIVWARDLATGGIDFKINNNGYLTYFQSGWMVMDSNFNIIDSIEGVNGFEGHVDDHDMVVYPDGHAFLLCTEEKIMNLAPIGGQPNATVTGLVIQELDKNHELVFEWRSWDHFLITDANPYVSITGNFVDYVHANAIERDLDGNILISCRNMNELTKINNETGDIIWRMNGENNQFTFVNDNIPEHFHSQHDLRKLPNGNITLFNNGNALPIQRSSAKEYSLDEVNKIATLVWYYEHPDVNGVKVYGNATGSVQRLPNGNTIIDWGFSPPNVNTPDFTEVNTAKNIVWEMSFDSIDQRSYRVHKYEWNPCSRITSYTMEAALTNTNKAKLSWERANGGQIYQLDYRALGAPTWITTFKSKPKMVISNLIPGGGYEWRVKTYCSKIPVVASGFSQIDTFVNVFKISPGEFTNEITDILIYPVPASDRINISTDAFDNATVMITNAVGSLVFETKLVPDQDHLEVDVKQWPAGIYMVEVKDEAQSVTRKIVVE